MTGARDGTLQLAANVPGLEGRPFAAELHASLGLPVTLENDINLAALGERWLGVARGVDDFVFLSVGTGMGAGIVLGGELHTGATVSPARSTSRSSHSRRTSIPLLRRSPSSRPDRRRASRQRARGRRSRRARSSTRRAAGMRQRSPSWPRSRAGSRSTSRPVAAVVDVELVVLGGGIGSNGDLLLGPVRRMLGDWLPFPPQVEVSTVGEAAVLAGALAVGVRAALENVAIRDVA